MRPREAVGLPREGIFSVGKVVGESEAMGFQTVAEFAIGVSVV